MQKFDLIIIGGGAAGFASAIKANELKAKTALVNDGLPLGGTCVNVGCVPSKTLLWAGELMHQAKNHQVPGIELEVKKFDFQAVIQDELALVEKMRLDKYEKVLKNLANVSLIEGKAKFVSETEIEVNGERLMADKFVISTGSTATVLPIEGLAETGYITHIEALKLKVQPKSMVVMGAGPVGLEFAQMFSRFGTNVTILQRSESIFRHGDKMLTARLAEILRKEGIIIKTKAEIKKISKSGSQKTVSYLIDGKPEEVVIDEILLASGKTANTQGLDLIKAGVEVDKKQAVIVSENYQTKNQNIFAAGDVVSLPLRLETTAGREGSLATENALKGTKNKIDFNTVPYTVFTDPQLAGVGLNEEDQMKKMNACACKTVSFEHVPKAIIMRRTEGLIRMNIHPETTVIEGVHILAPSAGELIAEAMMLVKNKNTIDDVINSIPMFPTLSEAIKLVAMSFRKDISKLSCCV